MQERLEDLKKDDEDERTPSPTVEEPLKVDEKVEDEDSRDLVIGEENFPKEAKVARKRPKRADDPCKNYESITYFVTRGVHISVFL